MKKCFFAFFSLFCAAGLFADYNPPDGGEELYDLVSPLALAGGPSLVSTESPLAGAINPAASALAQRISLDLNYIGLADFNDDGWEGHVVNLGAGFPTRYGVLAGSVQYLSSVIDQMYLGQMGTLRASFAKDLYSDLLVGAGLHFTGGSAGRAGSSDFGLAADFGFIHFPGDFFGLENFRWGATLRNAGKWYAPVEERSAFPSPFTPALGAGFTAAHTSDLVLDLTADICFPAVQNFRAGFGAGLTYKEWISLNASTRFDLRQTIDDDLARRSPIPAFAISVIFKTDLKTDIRAADDFIRRHDWERSDGTFRLAAAPLHKGIIAMGAGVTVNLGVADTNPPQVEIDYPEELYISPNLDGIADALEIPLSITDERYLMEYRLIIEDAGGNPVRVIENKEKRPENETFGSVIDRLLAEKKGIEVPPGLRWDGVSDSGTRAPDGEYTFHIEARDDNGNETITERRKFIIDTLAPSVDIAPLAGADLIFSPNDDGSKDVLVIRHTGSAEDLWEAHISDSGGNPVRAFSWRNSAPGNITWDGKNDELVLLPDGVYSYSITSQDRAGNSTEKGFGNIIIDTEPTPVSLTIDRSYFSPNGDGVYDTVTLTPLVPVIAGLESWELTVTNEAGRTVRRYAGASPQPVAFDGRAEDSTALPEGAYRARLLMVYRNGNRPQAGSPVFFIDLQKPAAHVWSDVAIFSPNGDGSKDEIEIFQESSDEDKWTGTIRGADGKTVCSYIWQGKVDGSFIWNATGESGVLVPDGAYTYRIECTDRAGNSGGSNILSFTINTEETPVILSADLSAFSPNRDGVKDVIRLTPVYKVREGIESSVITIRKAETQEELYASQARGGITSLIWDGTNQAKQALPDGNYFADIAVYYQNGNASVSKTGVFEIDTKAPQVQLASDTPIFSPDGDGFKDMVNFTQISSSETLWEGKIINTNNADVKTFYWKGQAENFFWDGTDSNDNKAPDGVYSYIVGAEDRAGNRTRAVIRDIRLDTRPVRAFITASETGFSPNGDGVKEGVDLGAYLSMTDGLESWRLELKDSRGVLRKTFTDIPFRSPMKFTWDGKADDGEIYEDTYTAEFSAVYDRGSRPRVSSTPVLLDISAPEADIGLAPIPFSPDNDGIDDELSISLAVRDESPINAWNLLINDRTGKMFITFEGKGMPASSIIWDGRSSTGELVIAAEDYPFVFTVSDAVGNTRRVEGKIPVDILVIRDGDKLKIRISNINFAPNSPEVILDSSETGQKNLSVLRRLAEVFTKYSGYQVLVEGHANNISGTAREETEELAPLSLARAQEVRKALVAMGLPARRITAEGRGGRQMLFPFSDRDNNWKNRRVEFILLK
ncbi:MAG: gliding motility-associated C-terminal domain-containing protein [Spirochaetales bacterium]|jgi:flagellar hook assembly protein FlgD/outer membrane protein OmpA-like peptidoglycan-associated protein|nr:gliding motility-associated C-terminal domain-containing protein [Spirochaetales bacterium]